MFTALLLVGVISAGFYFISNKIVVERKLEAEIKKNIRASLALRSFTDHVKYAIRKGWCIDKDLMPYPPENCIGKFTTPESKFSTTRLLMPPAYADYLFTLQPPGLAGVAKAEDLMLQSLPTIDISVHEAANSWTSSHPLKKIVASIANSTVKTVRVKVQRIDNITLPVSGDEVYLETEISLLDSNREIVKDGSTKLRETNRLLALPRELNSFSLVVAGDMFFSPAGGVPADVGNFVIPNGTTADPGVIFNSPVFINGSIHINKSKYTPVTFNDSVVLGNGQIKDGGGNPYTLGESLGNKRYWSETGSFGGFVNGFDTDSKRDPGLNVLAGLAGSTPVNNQQIAKCIDMLRGQTNTNASSGTVLTARKFETGPGIETPTPQSFKNRLSFTSSGTFVINRFSPQVMPSIPTRTSESDADKSKISYSTNPNINLTDDFHKIVMWADVSWDGQNLRVPIFENSSGTAVTTRIKFHTYKQSHVTAAENYKNNRINNYNNKLDDLNDHLANEPKECLNVALNPVDGPCNLPKVPNPAHATWVIEKNLKTTAKNDAETEKNNATAEYNKRKSYVDNPAELEINSVKPILFAKYQSPFRDFSLKINNADHFNSVPSGSFVNYGDYNNFDDMKNETSLNPENISRFRIEGIDISGKTGGDVDRPYSVGFNYIYHKFTFSGSDLTVSNRIYRTNTATNEIPAIPAPLNENIDYAGEFQKCIDSTGGVNTEAFKPAGYEVDFSPKSFDSWYFAGPQLVDQHSPSGRNIPDGIIDRYDFPDEIISAPISPEFRIVSIRRECRIKSTAKLVAGFYVCEKLIIEPRTTPLDMIGTFIVTRNADIPASAIAPGISWYNIHNQIALKKLKTAGIAILKRANGSNCATLHPHYQSGAVSTRISLWHPNPAMNILADRIRCSPNFLLQGKNPPRWTAVDPDSGKPDATATANSYTKKIRNFNIIPLERTYGL